MRHLNQSGLLPQATMDQWSVAIIGTGAIGSFVAMALTKMGFKKVVTWDPDKIEDHNIANQIFPVESVGKRKAVATREMVKQFSGEDIVCLSATATGLKVVRFMRENFPNEARIYLLCVDSLDTRRQLAEELNKDYGARVIDARMGAKTFRVLGFTAGISEDYLAYAATLVSDKDAVQEPCGQKSIIYTVLGVAAEVCSFVHHLLTVSPEGSYCLPEPVIFDYGTGMRMQKMRRGHVENLEDMPGTPEPAAQGTLVHEVPF